MKCIIIGAIFIVLTTLVRCDQMADIQQINRACLAEARVTEAELKDFFSNGMKHTDANDNIKCHMKCVMEKKGNLKNGVFDEASTIKSMKEMPQLKNLQNEIENAVRECKNERGTNDCDTAFKITMCLKEFRSNIKA